MKKNNLNPIYNELLHLKLIKKKNIINISKKTRDKKISVLKDKETKIIFLEKFITNQNYYSSLKYDSKKVKTLNGNVKTTDLDDDKRRLRQFQKLCVNKKILDFGCGWGGFLTKLKNAKSLNGIELRKECIEHLKKNKKINVNRSLNNVLGKFDIITMFHVLEHMPNQTKTLKLLRNKLKKNGKIIIDVPHAEDFLLEFDELKEFKEFTFWSEHLILHTYYSLKTILKQVGFRNIKINYFQRYGFDNHLGWFIKKKPGGHEFFKDYNSKHLNYNYIQNLIKIKKTDTLIAVAKK